ncbi:heavy metal-binding domain-containing protein [Myxococcota bacterium]|nr:heavy metal-binding domain-containing protein [Myxococcota bacterium]
MDDAIGLFFSYGSVAALILIGWVAGSWAERKHFAELAQREREFRSILLLTTSGLPEGWAAADAQLVNGSVVVSLDYFKRFMGGLRGLIGGRIRVYEPLLERARREALLRMKEDASEAGFDAVVNVRVETSRLVSSRGNNKGTAGIEILAYGTGVLRAELKA